MPKIELLAPAGNFDCLVAAVQSGADAVYFAGKKFGARNFADNFDSDELEKAVDYCHLRNTSVYVTVNTLVTDPEIEELKEYLCFLARIGVDAVIVQDLGVAEIVRTVVPELPIHASTQMTIHNLSGVNFLKKYNIRRVVLSRELSLDDIRNISANSDVELEVFAHGALCMCYSGQCLLSSIIGGRSGNRGKCAQPCRLPYSVNKAKDKSFIMSLRDLCGLEHINDFCNAGVASLKIEGRMKGPAYVAAVVGIYRKYIDNPHSVSKKDFEILDAIFNRGGLTDGYLTGKIGKEMFALQKPDNPYLKGSSELEKVLLHGLNGENRKTSVTGRFSLKTGVCPEFTVENEKFSVRFSYPEKPEPAIKNSVTKEGVIAQLSKTGGTTFGFDRIEADVDDGLFVSAGTLNKIRRKALLLFEKTITDSYKRSVNSYGIVELSETKNNTDKHKFVCEITNFEQFDAIKCFDFDVLYVPLWLLGKYKNEFESYKEKIIIVLPAILRNKEYERTVDDTKRLLESGYHGVLIHNISLIEDFSGYRIYTGFRLNIFNSFSLNFLKKCGIECCELSPELTLAQIKGIRKVMPVQTMVYGRLPLTVSENCLVKNGAKCPCDGKNFIVDRLGMKFPVIKDGNSCRSVILNCKKTFMGFEMQKIVESGVNFSRIYFTDESPEECVKICKTFLEGDSYRPEDFTKGHYYKGVIR
ncbi:MAG: U32 family peptidase [Clostridia bacterium]|nr:U32 family peptidase [Clostridia bacterium]